MSYKQRACLLQNSYESLRDLTSIFTSLRNNKFTTARQILRCSYAITAGVFRRLHCVHKETQLERKTFFRD